jgi:serine/threonine protein kinase
MTSILLLLVMLILLIIFAIKYCQMKNNIKDSPFHEPQVIGKVDETKPAMSQLAQIRLPDNFASQNQIRTFLSYINGDNLPLATDDFKELGRGQFGVVYQVRLPDVELVAAKTLPETIRNAEHGRDKHKRSIDLEETQEMISKREIQKKKAAEMLIDEIKVMHKAGKHLNIVALKKVAYPETKFRFLFTGGPIRDEDSFYLMELCSNGSLESMLKRFIEPSKTTAHNKLSLYETLSKQPKSVMTVAQAYEQCLLTEDDLKLIAYQVACGVDYLNRRQIVHCDIASRNVLVTSRFIMKICDFGYEILFLNFPTYIII